MGLKYILKKIWLINEDCVYVNLDFLIVFYFLFFSGNLVHPLGDQVDEKSGQWFGATVRSSGEDGVVVVSVI